MKHPIKFKNIIFFILFFAISLSEFQLHAAGLRKMESNQGKVAKFLLLNFVIGNIIAWSMGAYPRSFDQKPYTVEEQAFIDELQTEIKTYPDEAEPKKELGLIFFNHNDLDSAAAMLENALEVEPNHAESLAIWGANEAKSAGAMWDFTWGLWKLSRIDDAIEGLNRAVELAPDNINVRLFHLNTLEGLAGQSGSLQYAFEDEQWYLDKMNTNPDYLPIGVQLEFLDALSRLYIVNYKDVNDADKDKNLQLALLYFNQLKLLPVNITAKKNRIDEITKRFSELNIQAKTND